MHVPETISQFSALQAKQAAPASLREHLMAALVVAVVVAAASLFGVWTRLAGQLAVFWPANALLLGLLVRFRRLDNAGGWLGAATGYLAAGYLAGDKLPVSVLLTMGNFASVIVGYLLIMRLTPEQRKLRGAGAVLHLLWVIAAAALAAGLAGSVVGRVAFGADMWNSGLAWLASEIVNYIAILPAMLSLPALQANQWHRREDRPDVRNLLPLAALVASLALAVLVGGPGAIVFPLPALLWCGMRYSVFATSVLALLCSTWTLSALARGTLDILMRLDTAGALTSVRLGVSLIALSPIALAGATAANRALLAGIRHMANHDALTGIMNRRAFTEQAQQCIERQQALHRPVALLLVDIDHFKAVNDTHGHNAGDAVLVQVAQRMQAALGAPAPMFGRLGGEEFAVLLAGVPADEALRIAERVRQACAQDDMPLEEGRAVRVTLSVGVDVQPAARRTLEQMLQRADQALYQAKRSGRDRVVASEA